VALAYEPAEIDEGGGRGRARDKESSRDACWGFHGYCYRECLCDAQVDGRVLCKALGMVIFRFLRWRPIFPRKTAREHPVRFPY
jgi:hypothetical protein